MKKQIQAVHWVILAIVTFLTLLVISEPVIVFIITKNWYSLVPATGLIPIGYAWKRILDYSFPKDPQDYELEKEKIRAMIQIQSKKYVEK